MRRGTKKCILLLLAILLLCLLAWRLTPHTFEEMTASDRDEITSLAGVVSLSGVRDGRAYTESYALQNVTPEDTAFEGVLMLLNSTRYREDFRNLLPWPIESVSAGRAYDGRGVSLMLVWGPSADECCALSLSGRQIGQTLDRLLEGVLDGRIPNDRAALLRAAKEELACSTIPTKP